MRSITFSTEAEIDIDIFDVWERMNNKDKQEFLHEIEQKDLSNIQQLVYEMTDDQAKEYLYCIEFYAKNRIAV